MAGFVKSLVQNFTALKKTHIATGYTVKKVYFSYLWKPTVNLLPVTAAMKYLDQAALRLLCPPTKAFVQLAGGDFHRYVATSTTSAGTPITQKRARRREGGVTTEGENPRAISSATWQQRLTPEQYHICRQKGTEPPFTNIFEDIKTDGTFACACCGNILFSSDTKFNSGSGWPSFTAANESGIVRKVDKSHGMNRTEILCRECDAHLGHVFPDGPKPTGERFCINSVALDFIPNK